ncbi:MAG: MFS transporter [Anaerocolumna aminovalerica]|uniref:MFS transporter n=1 Tax=Anaerocolumna aminovalerica TaxID=1527 RepID=UPI00290E074E|nr:MFS transporter [Anaerocolumna aminovalerica]MDU6265579.1 MFS transporter [Anaerocolumna aminovalerica]
MEKGKFQTSRFERLSYGGFFLGQNIIYVIPFQFLAYFYLEYVGLKLEDVTFMLLIAKVWDAVNDPIMGAIVDKCNFKKGKYLPWLKVVTYLLPLSLVLMFINPDTSYTIKLFYAYATYILFDMIYTISDSPLFSLSTVMSSLPYERDILMSYGRFAAAVAAILSAVFMSIKEKADWTLTVVIYCFVAFLFMFPLQFKAKERVEYSRNKDITFREIFKYLFKNKYLLIYYLGYMAIGSTNSLQIMAAIFANSNLGSDTMVTVIMGVSILPIIIIAPFLPKLINKFGKKKITVFCSVATIIMCVIQYAAGYDNLIVFLILSAIRVVFMQTPLMLYGMFTADCIEYGAYINGERTEGIAFSLQTFITKLSAAVCQTLCLALLSVFGYAEQAATQSAKSLHGIWIILSLMPIVGYAIMIIIMGIYKLDEKKVEEMLEHNKRRDGNV